MEIRTSPPPTRSNLSICNSASRKCRTDQFQIINVFYFVSYIGNWFEQLLLKTIASDFRYINFSYEFINPRRGMITSQDSSFFLIPKNLLLFQLFPGLTSTQFHVLGIQ